MADRERLKQALLDLLLNAIKYNRPGGRVTITCEQAAAGLTRISVVDTGYGIEPPDLEKIFLPFERLDAARIPVEGAGLGLSVARRMIELMGGTLGAESSVGHGSTFWIELPSVEAPLHGVKEFLAATEAREQETSCKACSVLYIEDNLASLKLIERILARRPGLKLVSARHGRDGLELAAQQEPAVILLDLPVPDIDANELLAHLRNHDKTAAIPVVLISDNVTARQAEELLAAGATAYLEKPIDVQRFRAVMDEALARQGY